MRAQARCVSWTIPALGWRTTRSCCCRLLSGFSRAPVIERLPRCFRPRFAASGNRWTHSAAAATAPPALSFRPVAMMTACRGDMRGPRLFGPALSMALDRHTSDRLNCWRRCTMPRRHCATRRSAVRVRAGSWVRRWSRPRASNPEARGTSPSGVRLFKQLRQGYEHRRSHREVDRHDRNQSPPSARRPRRGPLGRR
jgi:hypothetical protein